MFFYIAYDLFFIKQLPLCNFFTDIICEGNDESENGRFRFSTIFYYLHNSYHLFFVNEFNTKLTLVLHSTVLFIKVNHFDEIRHQITKLRIFTLNKKFPSPERPLAVAKTPIRKRAFDSLSLTLSFYFSAFS